MKRLTALFLSVLLVLGLAACGEPLAVPTQSQPPEPTPTPAQTQPFALGYDSAASLHPITGDSQVNLDLASLIYEGLYALDNSFEVRPVLAQSAQVDETGLVWTIQIEEGILFSDGTPLTAAHVVSSLNTARRSDTYGARLADVTAVREKDGAVTVTLAVPNGALPALLDIPVVLEQESGIPLGTGRYRYVDNGEALFLSINVNREGWDALPYDTIPLRDVASADRRMAAFNSGEVSALSTDFNAAYTLGYSDSYESWDYPTTNLFYVGFQTTKGVCQNAAIRKACSLAFDRGRVVQSLMGGHGDPACLPISPCHEDYDSSLAALLAYDIQTARELLLQEGYKLNEEDGLLYKGRTPLTMTLIVNRDSEVKQNIADDLARSLESIGVTVTVSKLGWDAYLKALQSGSFDLYLGEVRLTGDFDTTQLLTGSLNYGGWVSETAPALLSAWKAAEGDARSAAAAQLWTVLTEEVPIAPLCFKRNSLLVRWGMVSNLQPTRGDLFCAMEEWRPVR